MVFRLFCFVFASCTDHCWVQIELPASPDVPSKPPVKRHDVFGDWVHVRWRQVHESSLEGVLVELRVHKRGIDNK